jgi:hypothetical protein
LLSRLDDIGLRLTQSHLIGYLEDVPQRFRALAVKSAHGQSELVHRLDDLIDLLTQNERR